MKTKRAKVGDTYINRGEPFGIHVFVAPAMTRKTYMVETGEEGKIVRVKRHNENGYKYVDYEVLWPCGQTTDERSALVEEQLGYR